MATPSSPFGWVGIPNREGMAVGLQLYRVEYCPVAEWWLLNRFPVPIAAQQVQLRGIGATVATATTL